MEALEVERGNSFLNIGSGTGYLSTMVGLLLGPYGLNHNIEIHSDVIDYAKARLNEFIKTAVKFDHYDFCVPKFLHGNFLNIIVNEDTRLYDRIYVGTGVNIENVEFIKNLLNVNGVLVLPLDDYVSWIGF
jgi:protein-L-isoaspartate O-methyltransferase